MSPFNFIGNQRAFDYLRLIVKNQIPAQAYLFVGPAQVGKTTAAIWLAQSLLCSHASDQSQNPPPSLTRTSDLPADPSLATPCGECLSCRSLLSGSHPDYFQIEVISGKNQIAIEQIQELSKSLSLNPLWSPRKVVVVLNADKFNTESANCFLKTLEEPTGETVFILIADQIRSIPATIISRCQTIRFFTVGQRALTDHLRAVRGLADSALIHELAGLSGGRPGRLIALLDSLEEQTGYRQKISAWFKTFNSPLSENFKFIEELFAKQTFIEQQKTAIESLEILDALSRDLFLAKMKIGDYAHFQFLISELFTLSRSFPWRKILSINSRLRHAKSLLLTTNSNPRLVLENLLLEF